LEVLTVLAQLAKDEAQMRESLKVLTMAYAVARTHRTLSHDARLKGYGATLIFDCRAGVW